MRLAPSKRAPARGTLNSALRAARKVLLANVVFSFFINLALFASPLYMMQIYNRVLPSQSSSTLVMLSGLVCFALTALAALEATRSQVLVRLGARLERELSERVVDAAFCASLRSGDRLSQQALVDFDTIRSFVWSSVPSAMLDVVWAPLFVLAMFVFHPLLGLVALAGSTVLLVLAVVHDMATRGKVEEARRHASGAASFIEHSLRNVQTLEAMGMRAAVQRRWLRQRNEAIRLHARTADNTGLFASATKSARFLLQAALLGAGAALVINDELTPGAIVAASMLMSRALAPVEMMIGAWRQCVGARNARARLNELLQQWPSRPRRISLPAPRGALQVENVVAWLPRTEAPTLRRVTFKLTPGDVLAVIGSSGSGKSTLARLLVGAMPPYAGKIRLDNADIHMWNREELGPHLGYLGQDVQLFDGTVAENIARFGELESAKIVEAAKRADVHDMILRLPQSYETRLGSGTDTPLSGGQRQRIALARALYGNPVLVVLDEPNSSLDTEGERALAGAIRRMKRMGTSVVLISHRSRILRQADHLLMLKRGTAAFVENWQQLQVRASRAPARAIVQSRYA